MIDITIITVVKNDVNGIKRTLESIYSQSFSNYEHIIIDSNSSDGTSELIKKKINQKSSYLRENDNGIYDAINKGVKLAKGKYIGLLHSGDIFSSNNILSIVFNNLDGLDFIFGNTAFFKFNQIYRLWEFKLPKKNFFNPFKVAHTTLFIKKRIIKDLNFYNQNYKISSDLDFLIKLSKNKFSYRKVEIFLVFMKLGGLSSSVKNYIKKFNEDIHILTKHYGYLSLLFYIYKILIKFKGLLLYKNNLKIIQLQNQLINLIKKLDIEN